MPKGTVKWFNEARGYGFIAHEDGREIFVHYSSIEDEGFKTLNEGESVEFELEDSPRGPRAIHVKKVG
jgi:CspA family cold shock protein